MTSPVKGDGYSVWWRERCILPIDHVEDFETINLLEKKNWNFSVHTLLHDIVTDEKQNCSVMVRLCIHFISDICWTYIWFEPEKEKGNELPSRYTGIRLVSIFVST